MIRQALFGLLIAGMCTGTTSAFPQAAQKNKSGAPAKLVPLNKKGTVLIDVQGKRVLLKAKVVFRDGILEMLVCPVRTKEHEAILAVDAKAYVVHTGLLAIGAKPGKPAKFEPRFKPASGQQIDIFVRWKDKAGKLHRVNAKNWVRTVVKRYYTYKMASLPADLTIPDKSKTELRYDDKLKELFWFGEMTAKQRDALLKLSTNADYHAAIKQFHRSSQPRQLKADWVFGGSYFDKAPDGSKVYTAELGGLVCVANFPTAMIDLARESSAQNGSSLFEADTDKIPPLGTDVTVELIPVFKKKQ